jgi:Cu/Ag efflux pump CusA
LQGRLFSPLAYTKIFAMAAVSALMMIVVRTGSFPEHGNSINHVLIWIYRPATSKLNTRV